MRLSGFWISLEIGLALIAVGFVGPGAGRLGGAENPMVQRDSSPGRGLSGAAYAVVDLRSGVTLSAREELRLHSPVAPGSTMKVAALIALLESGTITPRTKIACTGGANVAGRTYPCTHPAIGRPLTPAEALAHSCNSVFAQAAARLPRRALESACISLGLGRPSASAAVVDVALGLGGLDVTPLQLLEMLRRVGASDSTLGIRQETRRVVLEGLRGAATFGTAAAMAAEGVDALAKTGSAGGAAPHGLLVALSPSSRPERGIVVLLSGGAGRDAAKIAAVVLRSPPTSSPPPPPVVTQRPIPAPVDRRASRDAPAGETSVSLPRTVRVGFARASGGYDVRSMPLEDYVARVVAGEAAIRSPEAALDALAITVRTFAAANMGRHGRDGFDLCDLTHCQVVRAATDATRAAAERTRGEALQYRGAAASVFYTASCGGRSEVPSAVWPGADDPPFLPLRTDAACGDGPTWSAEISASDLLRALRAAGFKGSALRDLRVASRTSSGRAAAIQIEGLTPPAISGQDFRVALGRTLGWNLIKSASFDVRRTAQGYRFTGKGSGHGVGLCVIGSVQMALSGASAAAILGTYFPGLSARGSFASAPAAPANVNVWLSGGDEPQRAFIENLAQHLWTSITLRASIRAVGGVTLRFHPTVESYRRATGQPWWVAATTHATDIQLLPASVLRDRGVLEQTMAHEIAHVVTAPLLAGRALWIQEGAAMYFAGEKPGVMPARVKCPADNELSRSTSPGALRDAYARAAACFAARIADGGDWRTIR